MESSPTADLELTITAVGESYELRLRLTRPVDGADIQRGPFAAVLNREKLLESATDPVAYGTALRDMLFTEKAATEFKALRAAAVSNGEMLRIRLHVPPDLHTIRWETILDPESDRSLALDSYLLLSRYLSANDYAPIQLRPKGNLRVLVAVAAPIDHQDYGLAEINAEAETAPVLTALADLQPDMISANWDALDKALRTGYDILYLVAHGMLKGDKPWLFLVDEDRNADRRSGKALADLLRSLNARCPRLVVLASCESAGTGYADVLASLGPQLAHAGVPAVLAMQGRLKIETNRIFAPALFRELLLDGVIDRAINCARLRIADQGDWWMPVLYTRLLAGCIWREPLMPSEPGAIYTTLPPAPRLCVGREESIRLLKLGLGIGKSDRRERKPIIAIHGFPGQGKTTIALALAYDPEIRQAFPGGVLWANLGENPQIDLQKELACWGEALNAPRVGEAPNLAEAIRRMNALLHERRMLLVVDDIWQKLHSEVFAQARGDCPLVLTTRATEIARHVTDIEDDRIRLPGLDEAAGLALLSTLAPGVVLSFEAACRKLISAVDGLPLALQVAGRLLDAEQQYTDIPARIDALIGGDLLEEELPYQIAHIVRETNSPTVAALLRRSIDCLEPEIRKRFIILGAFVAKPATFDLSDMAAAWVTDDPTPTVIIRPGRLPTVIVTRSP